MRIPIIPEERRYWVVRAQGGTFFDHFRLGGLVGLGHLDDLGLPNTSGTRRFKPDKDILSQRFKKAHERRKTAKATVSIRLAQINSFIFGMKEGDWVLTVGQSEIRYGKIISSAYLDNSPIVLHGIEGERIGPELRYQLRRRILWGPGVPKRDLPVGLARSFKANQTLFCLDQNWEAVCHTVFPAFLKESALHVSTKVRRPDRIPNYQIAGFLRFLAELEILSKEYASASDFKNSSFDKILKEYLENGYLTITSKGSFYSEGDIWNRIYTDIKTALGDRSGKWMIIFLFMWSLLFGNSLLGFDGVIDLQTRQRLWELFLERKRENRIENIEKDLQLGLPDYETNELVGSGEVLDLSKFVFDSPEH